MPNRWNAAVAVGRSGSADSGGCVGRHRIRKLRPRPVRCVRGRIPASERRHLACGGDHFASDSRTASGSARNRSWPVVSCTARRRQWQYDAAPMQLHPGDLGWFGRSGAEATAAAVRTWSRDGRILAVGLLDEPELLWLTIAPDAQRDDALCTRTLFAVHGHVRAPVDGDWGGLFAGLGFGGRNSTCEGGGRSRRPLSRLR